MAEFTYGPVELHLVAFDGDRPDPAVIEAIVDLVDDGTIRLLDFTIVSKSESGEISVVEIEDEDYDLDLAEIGITGDEDIEELAAALAPGTSAAIVAFELAWAKRLAEKLAASGSVIIRSERIPAPIVNDLLAQEEGE